MNKTHGKRKPIETHIQAKIKTHLNVNPLKNPSQRKPIETPEQMNK